MDHYRFRTLMARFVGMARKRSQRWVEVGLLPRWQRLYALWLTRQGGELSGSKSDYRGRYPISAERVRVATELAGRPVQQQLVTLMEKRADFREYFDRLNVDPQFHAKELARDQVAKNFEARGLALDKALDLQKDGTVGANADVRAVESFTRPFLEHAFPKKIDRQEQQPTIVIQIGESTRKLLAQPEEPQEVEYEIIENDKLLTDGED